MLLIIASFISCSSWKKTYFLKPSNAFDICSPGELFSLFKKTVKERSPEEGDVQQKSWPQSHPAWAALNPRRDERASSCELGDAAAKNFQPLTQFERAHLARGGAAAGPVQANPAGCRGMETFIIFYTGWEPCKEIIYNNIHETASEGTAGWHRHLKCVWNSIPN